MDGLIASLRACVGGAYVLVAEGDIAPYATDWRGRYHGAPCCVVLPGSTDEVAAVVKRCAEAGVGIVPQGGNTGLCGGATPLGGEVLVGLRRLNRIRAVDPVNYSITVEAGCTLTAVQDAAQSVDRLFPLSLAAEGSATIGGNLSTNAGGVQVLRYGTVRELSLGLEVVLADGRVWQGLRTLRKDNTGYSLKDLFIGAEGTLGVITAASLKLFSRPNRFSVAWAAVRSPAAAVSLLSILRDAADGGITAFEIIDQAALGLVLKHIPGARDPLLERHDWQVLIELSGSNSDLDGMLPQVLQEASGAGLVVDAVLAASELQAKALWGLRENISEAQRIEGTSIKHDIAVPVSRIPEFIERARNSMEREFPGSRTICFGHIGDGNLHYNLSKPDALSNKTFLTHALAVNQVVHDLAHDLGGTISAEHGLGQLKREEILRYKSEIEMDMMRSIKNALDPSGIFNPGKVL